MNVLKRDGSVVPFQVEKIEKAVGKAFAAQEVVLDEREKAALAARIAEELQLRYRDLFHIEQIQDRVEQVLAEEGYFSVSRAYILYREEHRKQREERLDRLREESLIKGMEIEKRSGKKEAFSAEKLLLSLERACAGFQRDIDLEGLFREVKKSIYPGIPSALLEKAVIQAFAGFMERDPAYEKAAGRFFLQKLYREVSGTSERDHLGQRELRESFVREIKQAVEEGYFDSRLLDFDLSYLGSQLNFQRDYLLGYRALETLSERYYFQLEGRVCESPQAFWMRVAMGLALEEEQKEERALEFYRVISLLFFIPSTPTLFHAGLDHPQLSSCYLSTVPDDLKGIFKVIGDNAQLSKWSGGIGNDWTPVRATGALIKSTRVDSQGVIPFLKIANDTTVAINRSGKRRGATCAYLETWHLDIEDFLDLRRNTGDERRRTHDMNTANWIPDLFMQRVQEGGNWTLFSPSETPDLHDLYGRAFRERYEFYEREAQEGRMAQFKVLEAPKLWRKMLTRLFETGHPWITFKDPSNVRSPQDHAGVVHNSNLCTEITLNNSADETAVCNLGSINLRNMVTPEGLDSQRLKETAATAMRMLDNVVDLNFYPTEEARTANSRHRPVGLGMMGLQDALFIQRIPFESEEALEFSDRITEVISYHALEASSELAAERGSYESFKGSKWDRGILPLDTLDLLEEERGEKVSVDRSKSLDWESLRKRIQVQGLRNSNTMALAPTATISNIAGSFPSTEPIYKNIYVKSNMSGEFTILNPYLIEDLKRKNLWDRKMLDDLKYYDGNLEAMERVPGEIKKLYREAFDISPVHLLEMAARRSKWIDQSQSHNVFMRGASGSLLNEIYLSAWEMGLKSTYYLRTLAATQIEKSTLNAAQYGYTQKRDYQQQAGALAGQIKPATQVDKVCSLTDPDCEACQ